MILKIIFIGAFCYSLYLTYIAFKGRPKTLKLPKDNHDIKADYKEIHGKISAILSGSALLILLILLPLGMKHIVEPFASFLRVLFFASIVFAIIGIVYGEKGRKKKKDKLARVGYYLVCSYFLIFIVGFIFVGLILKAALH